MSASFPKTEVAGIKLPRLIIGCNWISGFSHQTPARDEQILKRHSSPESVADIFATFMEEDVNAVLGLFGVDHDLIDAVKLAEERTGKEMILMDSPILNVDDNTLARQEAERTIKELSLIHI